MQFPKSDIVSLGWFSICYLPVGFGNVSSCAVSPHGNTQPWLRDWLVCSGAVGHHCGVHPVAAGQLGHHRPFWQSLKEQCWHWDWPCSSSAPAGWSSLPACGWEGKSSLCSSSSFLLSKGKLALKADGNWCASDGSRTESWTGPLG